MQSTTFRTATADDSESIADIYLTSRKQFLPYAPLAHSDDEVRSWMKDHLLRTADVHVAVRESAILGFLALTIEDDIGWIEQLYLHPDHVGQGLGSTFVALAKERLKSPIRLHTFQQNVDARRFYERHGFRPIEFGDGSGNEENCPDVLYEWNESEQ